MPARQSPATPAPPGRHLLLVQQMLGRLVARMQLTLRRKALPVSRAGDSCAATYTALTADAQSHIIQTQQCYHA